MEDLQKASELLVKALSIRQRYMAVSRQGFPSVCQRFLKNHERRGDPKTAAKMGNFKGAAATPSNGLVEAKLDKPTIEGKLIRVAQILCTVLFRCSTVYIYEVCLYVRMFS